MQLDNTRIAVRERNLLDTFDLALRVLRQQAPVVVGSFFVLVLPMYVINYVLIGWMMDAENRETFYYVDDAGLIARFVWNMTVLVTIEAPLASLLTTSYLGQAMFVERPSLKAILRDVWSMMPRVIWCQVLIRGVLAAWLLAFALQRYGEFDPVIEVVGMGGLLLYVLGLRFWRPFLMEIILLERNPLMSRDSNTMTVNRRSRQLHGPSGGDLVFRGIGTGFLAMALTLAVFGTFVFCTGVFLNDWRPGPFMIGFVLPISMWIVAAYLTVVRFLCYLDLRIRHEGWEVELRLRAEGERLRSRLI